MEQPVTMLLWSATGSCLKGFYMQFTRGVVNALDPLFNAYCGVSSSPKDRDAIVQIAIDSTRLETGGAAGAMASAIWVVAEVVYAVATQTFALYPLLMGVFCFAMARDFYILGRNIQNISCNQLKQPVAPLPASPNRAHLFVESILQDTWFFKLLSGQMKELCVRNLI